MHREHITPSFPPGRRLYGPEANLGEAPNFFLSHSLTRSTYAPVLVSIRISSPSSTNGGT